MMDEEYKGIGRQDYNCAYAYWDDDDINDDLSTHISGPFCGCSELLDQYGGGAGACGHSNKEPCEFWSLRGPDDHRKEKKKDWTEKDGRCNNSDLYLEIVDDIAGTVRNIRVGDNAQSAARLVVSRLAHWFGLKPKGE